METKLDVPTELYAAECARCLGTGVIKDNTWVKRQWSCDRCGGAGYVPRYRPNLRKVPMDIESTAHGMDDFNRLELLRARITALIGPTIAPLSYQHAQTVAGVVMDMLAEYLRERDTNHE